jgi:hypothetical protein
MRSTTGFALFVAAFASLAAAMPTAASVATSVGFFRDTIETSPAGMKSLIASFLIKEKEISSTEDTNQKMLLEKSFTTYLKTYGDESMGKIVSELKKDGSALEGHCSNTLKARIIKLFEDRCRNYADFMDRAAKAKAYTVVSEQFKNLNPNHGDASEANLERLTAMRDACVANHRGSWLLKFKEKARSNVKPIFETDEVDAAIERHHLEQRGQALMQDLNIPYADVDGTLYHLMKMHEALHPEEHRHAIGRYARRIDPYSLATMQHNIGSNVGTLNCRYLNLI